MKSDPETESDFTKYLAAGVFTGALIAASIVLFLVFSSGGAPKGGNITPAQETLTQNPAQTVAPPQAKPPDEPVDDKRPATSPVRHGLKKAPPNAGDDGKRKRQDIIETSGKNPKMTQY